MRLDLFEFLCAVIACEAKINATKITSSSVLSRLLLGSSGPRATSVMPTTANSLSAAAGDMHDFHPLLAPPLKLVNAICLFAIRTYTSFHLPQSVVIFHYARDMRESEVYTAEVNGATKVSKCVPEVCAEQQRHVSGLCAVSCGPGSLDNLFGLVVCGRGTMWTSCTAT